MLLLFGKKFEMVVLVILELVLLVSWVYSVVLIMLLLVVMFNEVILLVVLFLNLKL